jgi:S1-C subfamily serine protease
MFRLTTIPALLLAVASPASGQNAPAQGEGWESAAKKLQQATLTIRIWTAKPEAKIVEPAAKETAPEAVTVCSGVCVRAGQVVTAAMAGTDSQLRITLAGGKQAEAKLQVIDEFSGLALLKCAAEGPNSISPVVPIELAAETPAVGGSVMTASGWGVELPLVSLGIVAGTERSRPGANYPPLIQCDLRTTDTSSGAGVVDRRGKLIGIIVAADSPESRRGWAYAIPVSHVERLLRTADAQKTAGVTIIKRRRPVVGWRLDQEEEAIVVKRVDAGGAAEKAGIKVGDEILSAEGVAIRSVYQASTPTLYKQPGDTITYRLRTEKGLQDVKIVLGGGVEVASAPLDVLSGLIQPKVQVFKENGAYVARRPSDPRQGDTLREVFQPPLSLPEHPVAAPANAPANPEATPAEKIALLEKALDRYQAVIDLQRRQLTAEQKLRTEQDKALETLRAELDAVRRQLAPAAGK